MDHTEALDRASKDYEERVMLLLSKMSNTVGRLLVCTKLKFIYWNRDKPLIALVLYTNLLHN